MPELQVQCIGLHTLPPAHATGRSTGQSPARNESNVCTVTHTGPRPPRLRPVAARRSPHKPVLIRPGVYASGQGPARGCRSQCSTPACVHACRRRMHVHPPVQIRRRRRCASTCSGPTGRDGCSEHMPCRGGGELIEEGAHIMDTTEITCAQCQLRNQPPCACSSRCRAGCIMQQHMRLAPHSARTICMVVAAAAMRQRPASAAPPTGAWHGRT